jgi:hypothetical protein
VKAGPVSATGQDIHRASAEQHAAQRALEALGLDLRELSRGEGALQALAAALPGLPEPARRLRGAARPRGGGGAVGSAQPAPAPQVAQ